MKESISLEYHDMMNDPISVFVFTQVSNKAIPDHRTSPLVWSPPNINHSPVSEGPGCARTLHNRARRNKEEFAA
eukprot:1113540-Karenia_brevis.AAC.1